MFDSKIIKDFNDLELHIYDYITKNIDKIQYMKIREIAEESHVSTASIIRFCRTVGCDGFSEFKVKLKIFAQERQEVKVNDDGNGIIKFIQLLETEQYQENLGNIVEEIIKSKTVLFMGIGNSGFTAQYGARIFRNAGKQSFYIGDNYGFINKSDLSEIAIILSVSGETPEVIQLASRCKNAKYKILSITNRESNTLAKLSDYNLAIYTTNIERTQYTDSSTQVPTVYLLEALANKMKQKAYVHIY